MRKCEVDAFGNCFVTFSSNLLIFIVMWFGWSLGRWFVPTWIITFVTAATWWFSLKVRICLYTPCTLAPPTEYFNANDLLHLAMKDGSILLVMLSPNITNSKFLLRGCFLCSSFVGVSSSCIIFLFFPTVSHGFPLSWNDSKVFKISLFFWSTALSEFSCFFVFSSCSLRLFSVLSTVFLT